MEYTIRQKEYIDSVGGSAHASAIEIIGALETECASLKQRAWRAESRADEKWGLRKELAEALGVSDKCDDEALRAGLAAIRRLENERDDALARLDQYEDRNPVYPADLGRRTSNRPGSPDSGGRVQPERTDYMKDHETQENAAPGGTCAADGSVPGTPVYLGDQLRDSVHALLREAELNGFRIRVEPFAGGHTYGVGRAGEMLGKDAPNPINQGQLPRKGTDE